VDAIKQLAQIEREESEKFGLFEHMDDSGVLLCNCSTADEARRIAVDIAKLPSCRSSPDTIPT
jgi:hypothetical protein